MKIIKITLGISTMLSVCIAPILSAQFPTKVSARTSLNNDPEILELQNYTSPIKLLITGNTTLYASKTGNKSRKIGTLTSGSSVQLIAMTENVYRISGQGKYGKIKGWVSPKSVASQDPNFVENLKKFYQRQIKVNQFIANRQVAIGMTIREVAQALGDPTKKESTVTKDGTSRMYQYIDNEEVKHYRYIQDPLTGRLFRQLSHITTNEKSNTSINFENDIVTTIVSKDDNSGSRIRTIAPPIFFGFR